MLESSELPVTVIGGYLGSGKTTLVNHLLRNAHGRKLAVLVNDFGDLPIDQDLIEAEDEQVISIAGGCVCCSYGSDLIDGLRRLLQVHPRPNHVLIESSGVALPNAVASSVSLVQPYQMGAVCVVCDASSIIEMRHDRYLADTVIAQLKGADLVLLNKVDLAEPAHQQTAVDLLNHLAPGTSVIPTLQARLPFELILDISLETRPALPQKIFHDTSFYQTAHVSIPELVDAAGLARALARGSLGILRAKAILRDPTGAIVELQVVGRRSDIRPWRNHKNSPGNLVTIGIGSNSNQQHIERLVQRYICAGSVQ